MLYKAAAQGARKGKRRVGAPENTANPLNAAIAQLVEHLIRNEGVGGSNPSGGTNKINELVAFRLNVSFL